MTGGDRRIAAATTAVGSGNWRTAQADKGPSSRTDDEGRSTDIGQQQRSPDDAGRWQADTADGPTRGLAPPPGHKRSWDLRRHRCNQSTAPSGNGRQRAPVGSEGSEPNKAGTQRGHARRESVLFEEDTSCSFQMSMPTTQATGTPAASAAGYIAVASSATTESSLASTPVVTSTVTTASSPKRTMSLGDYKKTRGNMVLARDELEALFDVGSDADMEDGEEEDEGTSSSTRVDPSVGSRRPREDGSDASSLKRSRSGSNRPLADAGPLSSP
ncbi:unnamed protein product [Phytophthora fragariaefolia]|uniref:Unnamed protein product n=1 Tax=Phytophthora fragariaefolia TaxID=1490495 RepID=A0A9W6YGP4_9STRA|nr:unnamed protein product [Phytophthora fragariaefolia]